MAGTLIGAIVGGGSFAAGSTFFGATFLASAFTGAALGNMWDQHQAAKEAAEAAERERQNALKVSSSNSKTEDCPIAIIYGTCRVGGNIVYDSAAGSTDGVKDMTWCIALGEGEISAVREVKVNDRYLMTTYNTTTEQVYDYSSEQLAIAVAEGRSSYNLATGTLGSSQVLTYTVEQYSGTYRGHAVKTISTVAQEGTDGCSYTVHLGTNAQSADSRFIEENYSNTAFLAVSLHASDELTGSPVITSIVDGLKVKVWKNGAFVREFSRNPVWCLYDLMTNHRYGCGIKESRIDLDSFIECANYCDWTIDTGDGTGQQEARFVFDAVISDLQDADATIAAIAATFRGFVVYSEGIYKLRIEKAELPTQEFVEGESIISNSIAISRSSRFETPNRVVVQFTDPIHWTTDQYTLDNDDDIRERGLRDKTISFIGVKRRTQAARTANYIYDMLNLCPNFVEFKVPFDKIEAEPGDIVKITHSVGGYVNKLARILTIELDDKYELKLMCREYNPEVYSDDPNKYQVTDESHFDTQLLTPPNVANITCTENGYMTTDGVHISDILVKWDMMVYSGLKYYEVYYMYEGETAWTPGGISQGNTFLIRNANTNKRMKVKVVTVSEWNRKSSGSLSSLFYITGKDKAPGSVLSLTATQDPSDSTRLIIVWPVVNEPDIRGYEMRVGNGGWDSADPVKNDPTSAYPTIIFENKYIYTLKKSGTYNFLIKAVDNSGNYSENYAGCRTVVKIEPPNVENFVAYQNGGNIVFSWSKIIATDILTYELREGSSFDRGTVVATGISVTTYTQIADTEKTYRYWIKAQNRAGYYSLGAVDKLVAVTNLPNKNIIQSYNELTLLNGTHNNTVFSDQAETCLTLGANTGLLSCNDYPTSACNSFANSVTLGLKLYRVRAVLMPFFSLYNMYAANGTYETQPKDMGKIISATISANVISDILTNEGFTSKIQYATSLDGDNYTEWTDLTARTALFRCVKFRAVLATLNVKISPHIYVFIENIDVPDTQKTGTATIPVGGTYVFYNYEYHTIPAFCPTAIGVGLICEISSISNNKAFVRVYSRETNVDVGGQITWLANGF